MKSMYVNLTGYDTFEDEGLTGTLEEEVLTPEILEELFEAAELFVVALVEVFVEGIIGLVLFNADVFVAADVFVVVFVFVVFSVEIFAVLVLVTVVLLG